MNPDINSYPFPQCTSSVVREFFVYWNDFMYARLTFNRPDSIIHAHAHCSRVLLHGLRIGYEVLPGDAEALEILAHAGIFHDTRRLDEYQDTGHGGRASVYYGAFCREHPGQITLHPEAELLIRYHDLDDELGHGAIDRMLSGEAVERAHLLYRIFKDADALDRWRLGPRGLDTRFLRTKQALRMVEEARKLVADTMDAAMLHYVSELVEETMGRKFTP